MHSDEIQRCDQIANIVGRLARDLVKSAGGDEGDAASYRAKEEFYHRLDLPFRKWLSVFWTSRVKLSRKEIICNLQWLAYCLENCRCFGRRIGRKCGRRAAFVGRMVTENISKEKN